MNKKSTELLLYIYVIKFHVQPLHRLQLAKYSFMILNGPYKQN